MKVLSNNTFINIFCTMIKFIFAILANSLCLFANAMYDASTILKESVIYQNIENKKKIKRQSIWNVIIGIIAVVIGALIVLNATSVDNYKVKWYVVLVSIVSFLLTNLSNSLKYVIAYNNEKEEIININRSFKYNMYFPFIVIICYILTLLTKYVPILKYADIGGAIIIAIATILMGLKVIYNNLNQLNKVDDKINEIFKNDPTIKSVKSQLSSYGYSKKVTFDLAFLKNAQSINMFSILINFCNNIFKAYPDIEVISIIKSTYVERKMVNKSARNSRSRNSKKSTTKKNTKQKNKKR